jgi:hypothetical protein
MFCTHLVHARRVHLREELATVVDCPKYKTQAVIQKSLLPSTVGPGRMRPVRLSTATVSTGINMFRATLKGCSKCWKERKSRDERQPILRLCDRAPAPELLAGRVVMR